MKAEVYYREIADSVIDNVLDLAIAAAQLLVEKLGEPAAKGRLIVVYCLRSGWGYSWVTLIVAPEEFAKDCLKSRQGRIENFHGLSQIGPHTPLALKSYSDISSPLDRQ
jgi:hypothetical protein